MSWVWHLAAIWYYSVVLLLLVANHDVAWYGRHSRTGHVVVHWLVTYIAFAWYVPIIGLVKRAVGYHGY